MYSRPDKKSDIVRITPNDVVKAELTSDVIKEPEFDHYILIKKPNVRSILLYRIGLLIFPLDVQTVTVKK